MDRQFLHTSVISFSPSIRFSRKIYDKNRAPSLTWSIALSLLRSKGDLSASLGRRLLNIVSIISSNLSLRVALNYCSFASTKFLVAATSNGLKYFCTTYLCKTGALFPRHSVYAASKMSSSLSLPQASTRSRMVSKPPSLPNSLRKLIKKSERQAFL